MLSLLHRQLCSSTISYLQKLFGRYYNLIRLEHITAIVDDRKILDDVSFHVKNGETKVILGPSGAGKSSLLKIILGLWRPDTGRVFVDNTEITHLSERA